MSSALFVLFCFFPSRFFSFYSVFRLILFVFVCFFICVRACAACCPITVDPPPDTQPCKFLPAKKKQKKQTNKQKSTSVVHCVTLKEKKRTPQKHPLLRKEIADILITRTKLTWNDISYLIWRYANDSRDDLLFISAHTVGWTRHQITFGLLPSHVRNRNPQHFFF